MIKHFKAYATNQYAQMTPERLVLALYDGAITNMFRAEDAIRDGRQVPKGEAISKAVSIFCELQACLNHQAGGELSERLEGLYDYIIRGLVKVNLDGDLTRLAELRGLVEQLREGWSGMMESLARDKKAAGGAYY
jgi:flagellar protein FliS